MANTINALAHAEEIEVVNNVLDFPSKLKVLREDLDPSLVKQREGYKDSSGRVHMVDYIEWHTVADILDRTTPDWSHEVKNIKEIGKIVTVTVAITIDGITREGIGTGFSDSETGIKKAEHDALKRAAVKFGVARKLYQDEASGRSLPAKNSRSNARSRNPMATSLSNMITRKQLSLIKAIASDLEIDPEAQCEEMFSCSVSELSKTSASSLITKLEAMRKELRPAVRRAVV